MGLRIPPSLCVLAAAIGLVALTWPGTPAATQADREVMLGTWTDNDGPPGNSIRFYLVPTDIPGAPFATALEGHVTVVSQLGETTAQGIWNFGSCDPLVLNVMIGNRAWYVAIRRLDADHILARFGSDPEEMMRPGAIDHPEAKVLTSVADRLPGDEADKN